jgi:hypothetical protein
MNELRPHHEVVIEEFRWFRPIQADATYMRRQVNHNILLVDQALTVLELAQVTLKRTGHSNFLWVGTRLTQLCHDLPSQKTRTACNHDALVPEF